LTKLLRAGLSILCVFLILLGALLLLVSGTRVETAVYSSLSAVCQNNYSTPLTPYEVTQTDCSVLNDYSVVISMNSSLNIVVTVWTNESGHSIILYNASGAQCFKSNGFCFNADFPTLATGSIHTRIANPQGSFVLINGFVSVYAPLETTARILVTVHPYTTAGYGIIGGSAIVLFLLIWNPRKMTTKTLDYLTIRISRRFRNSRTKNVTND